MRRGWCLAVFGALLVGCGGQNTSLQATPQYQANQTAGDSRGLPNAPAGGAVLKSALASAPLPSAPRDTAVWVDPKDSGRSLILATHSGGLSVLGLDGKIVQTLPLQDAQGVDVQYSVKLGSVSTDIVVAAEAGSAQCRVYTIDPKTRILKDVSGSVGVFGSEKVKPESLALYKSKSASYVFVSRSPAPLQGCVAQFQLVPNGAKVDLKLVRSLGELEAEKPALLPATPPAPAGPTPASATPPKLEEPKPPVSKPVAVTALFVDSGKGKVYFTDPNFGVREYSADPSDKGQAKVASGFARTGLAGVLHGLAVSRDHFVCLDQAPGGSYLRLFSREARGEKTEVARVKTEVSAAEAVEVVGRGMGKGFPGGLMVVADGEAKTLQFYDWREVTKLAGVKG